MNRAARIRTTQRKLDKVMRGGCVLRDGCFHLGEETPGVMVGGASTWVSGQRHLLCGHSWLSKIKNHTTLAGRLFLAALELP